MADDNETAVNGGEAIQPLPEAATPKKRAPRRSRAEIEATSAKKGVAGRKRIAAERTASATEQSNTSDTKPSSKPARVEDLATTMSAADEMAELQQLETENQQLRNALGDKLRSENADLRKRLGL